MIKTYIVVLIIFMTVSVCSLTLILCKIGVLKMAWFLMLVKLLLYHIRLEAFTAIELDKIFSENKQCQGSFPWWWRRRWSPKRWAFIHNWHGLLPEKNLSTTVISFTRKIISVKFHYKLYNNLISRSQSVEILGALLDSIFIGTLTAYFLKA
jgi:hypothetical protein